MSQVNSDTTSALSLIRANFQQRFRKFVTRRLKPARLHKLDNRRLFIFPSKAGIGFLAVNILMWLTGTNYENNLILALAFFQVALFVVCIHHTFFNMSGLTVEAVHAAPCYRGDNGEMTVLLSCNPNQSKESIQLGFDKDSLTSVDLIKDKSVSCKLFVETTQRGWFYPDRLLVKSYFPLGLIRCWTLLAMDLPILVYPKPLASADIPISEGGDSEGDRLDTHGSEDFFGLKSYQSGDSPKHIAWKHFARGQGLYSKEYATYRDATLWLDWDALEGDGVETRLSKLCYWVIKLHDKQQVFGLRLPGVEFEPDDSLEHKQKLLKALALFGSEKDSDLVVEGGLQR